MSAERTAEMARLREIDVEELAEASRRDRPGTAVHLLEAAAGMLARAWDEGQSACGADYMRGFDANSDGLPCPPPTPNPYRVYTPGQTGGAA